MSRAAPRYRRRNPNLPAIVNDVFRVRLVGDIESQETVSVFYYSGPTLQNNATSTHLLNLGTGVESLGGLSTKFAAVCSADWTLTGIIVDCPTTPTLAAEVAALAVAGTGPTGHMPTEVGMPMIRQSAVKGQCGRGRVTTPAVPLSWVTNSRLSNLTAHQALATQMALPIVNGGDTFTPCIYSAHGSRTNTTPGSSPVISVATAAGNLLGTIRRRKIGRGK